MVGGGGCDHAGDGDHKDAKPEDMVDCNVSSAVLLGSIVISVCRSERSRVETMHQQHSDDGKHGQSGHQGQPITAVMEDWHRPHNCIRSVG